VGARKQLVWQVERKLIDDAARPIIFFPRGAQSWRPELKGLTIMANSIYNGQRFEDLWLDKYPLWMPAVARPAYRAALLRSPLSPRSRCTGRAK